jgi:very-short-patch-repair endonuclease
MYRRHKIPITRNQRVSPEKVHLAKEMRRTMTPSEAMLWKRLKGGTLAGLHFRRQQIIGGFIADFYGVAAKLAVELDGPIHDNQTQLDHDRDQALATMGIRTLRFRNEEVANDADAVLQKIIEVCAART